MTFDQCSYHGGRDHILPAWLPAYTPYLAEEMLVDGPVRMLGDFSVVKDPRDKVQDTEYMHRFGYSQAKDLLFPWHLLRDPSEASAPAADAPRSHFIYFAASTHTLVSSANVDRMALVKQVKAEPDSMFVEMSARFPPKDVQSMMRNSTFCPAPPGDTQLATKHYDAILAGCIPVVLTDGRVPLPYDNVLDWSKFAILLPVSSLHDGSFIHALRAKGPSEVQELRKWVYAVRPYFMISPNCTGPSAVDMFLHQLALQRQPVADARIGFQYLVLNMFIGAVLQPNLIVVVCLLCLLGVVLSLNSLVSVCKVMRSPASS